MIGKKDNREEIFHYFQMRDLIPDDHILKLIDRHVDFSFIREKVRHLYSETGRPSVDPELMVRMLLVGYCMDKVRPAVVRRSRDARGLQVVSWD